MDHLLRLATQAMGTRFEVALFGDDQPALRAAGEAALEVIDDWHERLNRFAPGSLISYINRTGPHKAVQVDEEMFELLSACEELNNATGGMFDVTLGAAMRALGFSDINADPASHDTSRDCKGAEKHPLPHRRGSPERLTLDHNRHTVHLTHAGIELDLGGIGKGHALDEAARVLRELGITCALLHGGTSTVVALGAPPGEDGWRIAIHDPDRGEAPVVSLADAALAVSAPHGRTVNTEDGPISHILDPTTGESALATTLAAVIGPSARTADAWSTALIVLGSIPDRAPAELTMLIKHRQRVQLQASTLHAHHIELPETTPHLTEVST